MTYSVLAPQKATELAALYENAGSNKLSLAGSANGLTIVGAAGPSAAPSPELTPN